jgi:hypothetical protein
MNASKPDASGAHCPAHIVPEHDAGSVVQGSGFVPQLTEAKATRPMTIDWVSRMSQSRQQKV